MPAIGTATAGGSSTIIDGIGNGIAIIAATATNTIVTTTTIEPSQAAQRSIAIMTGASQNTAPRPGVIWLARPLL